MRENIHKSVGFLWATGIGGLFFLLPLVVLIAILGRVYTMVVAAAEPIHKWIPVNTPIGIAILFGLTVLILILLCFLAGIFASRAIGRKFSKTLEKQLMMVFPKYAIYKDILAGNLKGGRDVPSLKTVLVRCPEGDRLAFESDRLTNGSVVIFFPGAPDTWIGSICIVPSDRVESVDIHFADAVAIFERLGRETRNCIST